MIPILRLSNDTERAQIETILRSLRLDPMEVALNQGGRAQHVATVQQILADVGKRGDDAVVDLSRKFDDPAFTAEQIRVHPDEMREAAARVPADQMAAVRRSFHRSPLLATFQIPEQTPLESFGHLIQ